MLEDLRGMIDNTVCDKEAEVNIINSILLDLKDSFPEVKKEVE